MSCLDNANAVWSARDLPQSNDNSPVMINTEAMLDGLPAFVIDNYGYDCAATRTLLESLSQTATVGKNGSIIPAPTASMFQLTGTATLFVQYTVIIDNVPTGYITVEGGAISGNTSAWTHDFVAGVDYLQSLTVQMISAGGGSGNTLFHIPCNLMLDSFDFNPWWCCAAASKGCTDGCGAPAVNYAPRFLIPRPETPAPGEENVSVPPLNSLLLLTNHTFQFPANFGVNKK